MEVPFPRHPFGVLTRVDRGAFAPWGGLRAAIVILAPFAAGLAVGDLADGALATLGAYFFTFVEDAPPRRTSAGVLVAACFLNATTFATGTLVATAAPMTLVLLAAGVLLLTLLALRPRLASAGFVASLFFVIGVGLGGPSPRAAELRFVLALAGGLWSLGALLLVREGVARSLGGRQRSGAPVPERPLEAGAAAAGPSANTLLVRRAVVVAALSTVGLAIALGLDLTRGFWVMVTVVSALHVPPGEVVGNVLQRVMGTFVGGIAGYLVILDVRTSWGLLIVLFACCAAAFATRFASLEVMMIFVTPYLLVLQNILYPGSPELALARIVDVLIGGGLALLGGTILWLAAVAGWHRRQRGTPRPGR